MAAAEGSSFLDATLTGLADDPRLPSSLRADETPTFATDRVVPLFLRDIVSSMQVRQRLHLRLLSEQLDDLIEYDDTTQEEFEMLLVMLFSFTHRRGGLTPLQKRHNVEASDIAFTVLHRLIGGRPHAKYHLVLQALGAVCRKLGCSPGDADMHPSEYSMQPLPEEYAHVVDTVAAALPAAEERIRACEEGVASLARSAAATVVVGRKEPQELFPHASLFAYSLDALPAKDRCGVTEHEFNLAIASFDNLPKMESEDEEGAAAVADQRNFSEILSSGGFVGSRYVTPDQASKVRHSAEGGVALFDVIKFVFPLVPEGVLLKRIHGMILAEERSAQGQGEEPPAGPRFPDPPTETSAIAVPNRVKLAHELSLWLLAGRPKAQQSDAAQRMVRWFADTDYAHSGLIPVEALGYFPNPWEDLVRELAQKRRKTRVSVYDVLNQVFPSEAVDQLKEQFTLALRTMEKEHAASVAYKQAANTSYKLALVRFVELQEGGPNPGGDSELAMSSGEQRALAAFAASQWEEVVALLEVQRRLCSARHEAEILLLRQREAQAAQLEDLNRSQLALVEPIAGPEVPPIVCDIGGFHVNRTILELDGFLSDPGSKARAMEILVACDVCGIPAGWLLERPSEAHLFLTPGRPSCASPGIVYRDFSFSSVRPATGTHWKGPHRLRVVTNIAKGSDVKFRCFFEGYNFGVNKAIATTVVGHASPSLTRVGALESFGWPDGWDRSAVLHYSGGFEKLEQYYNDDGFVIMDVEAHSFSKVGFGVSVWLCMPEHGRNAEISLHVEHL